MLGKVFLILLGVAAVSSRHSNFFRKDYTYMEEYDAFYKFHWDTAGISWASSFHACDDEGAQLFYPQAGEEWKVVKKLMDASLINPNVTDIYVGIHDVFGIGEFLTIHGRPSSNPILNVNSLEGMRCVTMNIDTGVFETSDCIAEGVRPFVCKKVEDITCPTVDKGYKYFKETKKCYKFNDKAKSWSEAMETCYMEGGILLVLTSEMEANIIRDQFNRENTYYVGLTKIIPYNEFYTITGTKVQDSGFDRWYNKNNRINYGCAVAIFYNSQLYYNALECGQKLPFICEMEVN